MIIDPTSIVEQVVHGDGNKRRLVERRVGDRVVGVALIERFEGREYTKWAVDWLNGGKIRISGEALDLDSFGQRSVIRWFYSKDNELDHGAPRILENQENLPGLPFFSSFSPKIVDVAMVAAHLGAKLEGPGGDFRFDPWKDLVLDDELAMLPAMRQQR